MKFQLQKNFNKKEANEKIFILLFLKSKMLALSSRMFKELFYVVKETMFYLYNTLFRL